MTQAETDSIAKLMELVNKKGLTPPSDVTDQKTPDTKSNDKYYAVKKIVTETGEIIDQELSSAELEQLISTTSKNFLRFTYGNSSLVPTWMTAFLYVVGLISHCTSVSKMAEMAGKDALLQYLFQGKKIIQSTMSRFLTTSYNWSLFGEKRVSRLQDDLETQLHEGDVIARFLSSSQTRIGAVQLSFDDRSSPSRPFGVTIRHRNLTKLCSVV